MSNPTAIARIVTSIEHADGAARLITRVEHADGTVDIVDPAGNVSTVEPTRRDGTTLGYTVDWPTAYVTVTGDVFGEPTVLAMDRADLATCAAALSDLDRAAPTSAA